MKYMETDFVCQQKMPFIMRAADDVAACRNTSMNLKTWKIKTEDSDLSLLPERCLTQIIKPQIFLNFEY